MDDKLPYRKEDGVILIEMRLTTPQQLFNSLDPAPFPEKDLDSEAETYIVTSVREWPLATALKLVLYLPDKEIRALDQEALADALHRYFDYRLAIARREMSYQLKTGRIAFAVGLAFLFICVGLRQLVTAIGVRMLSDIARESLLILGWVAMWRPIQTFLYDWWPLRRVCAVYEKLGRIPVEFRAGPNVAPAKA